MDNDFRLIFMGTPDFAIPSLKALLEAGFCVAGVVTAPDKPAGRGRELRPPPVKEVAQENQIPVLQPHNLKDPEFLKQLEAFNPDLQVVVAFRKLPKAVWALPTKGTFNLHASLLPDYPGAAPIHWAIINGENETGVTTFFLRSEIDKGSIIFQQKTPIREDQTAGSLHDELSELGADLVVKTAQAIQQDRAPIKEQQETSDKKTAPKIFKEDCQIHWKNSLDYLYNFIRGLSPYPGAWTYFRGETFKIFKAEKQYASHGEKPGKVFTDHRNYMQVAVKGGFLDLLEVQLAGKAKMNVKAFLNGVNVEEGMILGA